jgi:hypothetical protein
MSNNSRKKELDKQQYIDLRGWIDPARNARRMSDQDWALVGIPGLDCR